MNDIGQKISKIYQKARIFWVTLYFTMMTIFMTWPLVTRMKDAMVGELGDNIYFVWMIGWLQKALFKLQVNPMDIWFLNYPEGWNLAYTEITPAQLFIALPFSLVAGPTFGYNAALLISFLLSGLTMYILIRRLTGNEAAALIVGTAFAFIPYRFAHFRIGHLNLSGTQWFPLFFLAMFEILSGVRKGESDKPIWKTALLGGISLGLIGLSSTYYMYMTAIVCAVLILVYVVFFDRKLITRSRFWKQSLLLVAFALPLVLLSMAPYIQLSGQGGLPDRPLGSVRGYAASASPTDYILPSTEHFLFGSWVGEHFNRDLWIETSLYVGMVTGLFGLWTLFKRKQFHYDKLIMALFWTGLFSVVLSFGLDLFWNGERLILDAPLFLQKLIHREQIPIPLPGILMFKYFPFYAKLRAFARFGLFAVIFTLVAAGFGISKFLERFSGIKKIWVGLLILLFVVLDLYPGPYKSFATVDWRPVDEWLADQPADGALIQFPFVKGEDQEQIYYTLIHEKAFVGGFFNAFPPAQYKSIFPIMEAFPDENSIGMLPELGVKYILVDVDEYEDITQIKAICEDFGLEYHDQMEDQMIFFLED